MAGQEKVGSKPSDLCVEAEELAGATTFVSSVEGEPVLMVEGVGISATAFAATSNLGFGVSLEGGASDDAEMQAANVFSEDNGVHVSDIVRPAKEKSVGDARSNIANASPDTDGQVMCNEKRIQPIQVGCMENQNHSDDVILTINEKSRVDGRVSVNDRFLVQAEYPHHENLSSELDTHGNEEAPSDAGPTTGEKLPEGVDVTTINGVLALADDNGQKGASVDGDFVQITGDREECQPGIVVYDMPFADDVMKDAERVSSEAGADVEKGPVDAAHMSSADVAKKACVDTVTVADDNQCSDTILDLISEMRPFSDPASAVNESPVVPIDDVKGYSNAIHSPVSEMRQSSGPANVINEIPAIPVVDDKVCADTVVSPVSEMRPSTDPASVLIDSQAAPVVDDKGCSDAILSSISEMRPSSDSPSVVNKSPAGDAGSISQENTSTNVLPNTQATLTGDAQSIISGRAGGHVISSLSVGVAEVVTKKVVGDAGSFVHNKPSASAVLSADIGLSTNAGILLEEKTTDFESAKDGKSSSATGHMFDIDAVADAGLNRDPAPSTDIVLSNNLNFSTKSQSPVDAVLGINPLDSNINVTSTDKLPSVEPASCIGAVTDEGLGFCPQQDDAVQTHVYRGGGETLVGQKVKKRFGRKKYMGEVVGFDPETHWYKVTYEDGDEEDLEWDELDPILLQSTGGSSVIRRRKRRLRSHVGELGRSFKRVRRPEGSRVSSRRRARAVSNSEMCPLGERNDKKEDDKDEHDDEDFSMVDSADRLSSPMRTTRRRHAEELHGTLKRRKVETGDALEKEQMIGLRSRSRLIMEAKHHGQGDSIEGKVSTRRSSVSSVSNLEGISGAHVEVEKAIPDFHDSAKSESLESSEKNAPPPGGGLILIGRKTRKDFGGQFYEGEVVSYDFKAKYYRVKYEDGDEEELEWSELEPTLVPSDQKPLSFKSMLRARNMAATRQPQRIKVRDQSVSTRDHTAKVKQALGLYEVGATLSEQQKHARHISRMEMNGQAVPASVLDERNEDLHWTEDSSGAPLMPMGSFGLIHSPPRPLAAARFASAGDADIYEYFSWGEVTGFDKAKCPELRAAKLLPTASPIVHLAASQHHLAAITATGQVWLWRNKHGNIHTRCNEWEHLASLEEKEVVLVDIAGPDLDRASGGYEADQEDQVPDPFYLVAVSASGEDFILQGSQPQEPVRTYQLGDESQYLGLKGVLSQFEHSSPDGAGKIVQVSVGTVEAPDESPFIGYITDTDHVYIRSATRDYMEEVNLVTGYTGKPIKIQCGRVYHAIIMTDDGRAWTWGRGYYPGLNSSSSSGFPAATCQPAVGTLVGRKVIDVGCYGEDFVALTSDGDVHQWSHAVPNPAAGVYNVPATPLYGQGPCIPYGDKLRQVSIGAGMCAGITDGGRVHTWRTAMKGGLVGILVPEREALTPLGHEEGHKDTTIVSLGHRTATKVMCVAGSLIVVVKKKVRSRMGPRRKTEKDPTDSGMVGHGLGH